MGANVLERGKTFDASHHAANIILTRDKSQQKYGRIRSKGRFPIPQSGHKETLYVQFEDPGLFSAIVANRAHKSAGPFYPEMGPLPTAIGIINKESLANGIQSVVKQVVLNPVSKIRCHNFPFNGVIADKARRLGNLVRPV